ncbi:metal-dependent hydrolase [Alkalimarinus sediminis]|uniref:Metal-dependent hydrolase n=1 Tax=Alkalimarinus sediminis TaxID=1632866 RepID=A0A9E8HLF7_9ALTE|nr:metal-dependent hydrolase [Alkalimarinus sediminis]UZW76292.1 metal-dependent hydrolase [Alkalimarinus sediminis]
MTTSSSAANIEIIPRKTEFDFSGVPERWLVSAEASHFMHALSVLVPLTERLVITRLRNETHRVTNLQLKIEIQQVIKQEGIHARHHRAVNQTLVAHGFTAIPRLEAVQTMAFDLLERWMPKPFVDSIPAAMEHFTANISKSVLTDQTYWFGAQVETDASKFLKWHAFEELEHQAVCFDLYKHLGHKSLPFSLSLILFWMPISALSIYTIQTYFLAKSRKLRSFKHWRNYLKFIRKTSPIFFSGAWKYSKKGYNPWMKGDQNIHQSLKKEME